MRLQTDLIRSRETSQMIIPVAVIRRNHSNFSFRHSVYNSPGGRSFLSKRSKGTKQINSHGTFFSHFRVRRRRAEIGRPGPPPSVVPRYISSRRRRSHIAQLLPLPSAARPPARSHAAFVRASFFPSFPPFQKSVITRRRALMANLCKTHVLTHALGHA